MLSNILEVGLTEEQKRSVAAIIAALKEHFQPRRNKAYERYVFNTCQQKPQESIDEYVSRLRGLSSDCKLGALLDSLIRDKIVLGTKHNAARSRLLTEKNSTLEKSSAICRSYEIASKQLKEIEKPAITEAYQVGGKM